MAVCGGGQNPATDYWRDTYYTPRLRADNAAFLHVTLESDFRIETSFTLHPELQFDQAGMLRRVWPRAGAGVCPDTRTCAQALCFASTS